MTVGSQVKGCLSAVKSAEATTLMLSEKAQKQEAKEAYKQAADILTTVKQDLDKQVVKIRNEEPQYKS